MKNRLTYTRIKEGKRQPASGILLLKLARLKGKGPRDLAQHHDAYDWKSPTHP